MSAPEHLTEDEFVDLIVTLGDVVENIGFAAQALGQMARSLPDGPRRRACDKAGRKLYSVTTEAEVARLAVQKAAKLP